MDVDKALEIVGGYRKWQLSLFLLLGFSTFIPLCWQSLAIVFIGWEPPHQCSLLKEYVSYNMTSQGINEELIITTDQCELVINNSYYGNATTRACSGWEYDSEYHTIVSEWDLVCDTNYLAEVSQTIYQAVMIVGDIFISYASDRIGRKPVHIIAHGAIVVFGTATAFSGNYLTFVILRAVLGLAIVAARSTGLTLIPELFSTKHRTFAGIALEFQWVVVYLLLPVFAFFITRWQHLQLLLSLASVVWVVYVWILPESPIWLVANGQTTKAESILNTMATRNGVLLPQPISLETQSEMERDQSNSKTQKDVTSSTNVRIIDMVLDRRLLLHSVISSLLWLANTSVYYGLILSTPSLAGDRFINFAIGGFVEIPANIIAFFAVRRFGRRLPTCVFHLAAGVPLATLAFFPTSEAGDYLWPEVATALAMLAKCAITASFAVIVLYTRELFPTNLRGTSGALITVLGGIGTTVAPFAAYAAKTRVYWLPNIIFGGLSIGVGLLTLLLPETGGKPLPQTLQDVHALYHQGHVVCGRQQIPVHQNSMFGI